MPSESLARTLLQIFAERAANELERGRAEQALVASEKLATMGSIVGAVAHEVRNPLFGLSATLDAFEARFGARPEYERHVISLRQQVDRLSELMRELLDYGRPHTPELAPAPLAQLVEETLQWCEPQAQLRRVRVTLEAAEDLPPIDVDATRMVRLFRNVIDNAIHHSPEGGSVSVVLAQAAEGMIECVVQDSGPGFDPEDLSKVFEPFHTRRTGGTGLGLAIAWKIVQEHGGSIVAANGEGGGAIVTVSLPASRA